VDSRYRLSDRNGIERSQDRFDERQWRVLLRASCTVHAVEQLTHADAAEGPEPCDGYASVSDRAQVDPPAWRGFGAGFVESVCDGAMEIKGGPVGTRPRS
jgi:hypothetical protein